MNLTGAPIWRNLRASFFRPRCVFRRPQLSPSPALRLRRLATKSSAEPSSQELAKQKPKAATQLRRTAAASLPIRANPNPTRSEIRPVSVLTTAERYLLPQLRFRLPASAVRLQSAWWMPKWAGLDGREGEIFVFENGSLVCWGLEEGDAQKFARDFISGSFAEVGHLKDPETEDVEFVTDPTECVRDVLLDYLCFVLSIIRKQEYTHPRRSYHTWKKPTTGRTFFVASLNSGHGPP